jgi:hypothetical protein
MGAIGQKLNVVPKRWLGVSIWITFNIAVLSFVVSVDLNVCKVALRLPATKV